MQYTVNSIQYAVYSIQYTIYCVYSTVYNMHGEAQMLRCKCLGLLVFLASLLLTLTKSICDQD